jgi:hypothetical protein
VDKRVPKITTPIKPLEISSMGFEENEEIHNKLSKLEEQLNELSVRYITSNDVVKKQIQIQYMKNKTNKHKKRMEKKMDEKMEHMENKMDESR